MKLSTKDRNVLLHMKNYCLEIEQTISFFGDSYELFIENQIYCNAGAFCILQIGELVTHFSDDFISNHSEIPWRQIKAMRNIIAHNYSKMDTEVTWETMKSKIPELLAFCESQLL